MTYRLVNGKPRWILVDENDVVINNDPSKEELKGTKILGNKRTTDEELLNFLNNFYEENGKVPSRRDFLNNPDYPDYQNYTTHFGNWGNTLKMVGLDLDTIVGQRNLNTDAQKGR